MFLSLVCKQCNSVLIIEDDRDEALDQERCPCGGLYYIVAPDPRQGETMRERWMRRGTRRELEVILLSCFLGGAAWSVLAALDEVTVRLMAAWILVGVGGTGSLATTLTIIRTRPAVAMVLPHALLLATYAFHLWGR